MDPKRVEELQERMRTRDTESLLEIFAAHDLTEWSQEALEAVRLVLLQRGETPPPPHPSPTLHGSAEHSSDDAVWPSWIAATTAGWIVGMTVVAMTLEGFFNFVQLAMISAPLRVTELTLIATVVGIATLGASVGTAQWFVLRSIVPKAGLWIVATTAGWLLAFYLVPEHDPQETSSVHMVFLIEFAAVVSVAQWLVLRSRISKAGWWVVATIAAILISDYLNLKIMAARWPPPAMSGVTDLSPVSAWFSFVPAWLAQGVVIGAITAFALERLRRPVERPAPVDDTTPISGTE